MGLLSLAIWTPILFGVVLLALGRDEHAKTVRWIALIGSLVSLGVTLPLYSGFDVSSSAMQFVEKAPWIERFNVFYNLGVDGLSLWFVLLTAFITVIVVIAGWEVITERVNQYMGAFLILSGLMIGVFSAIDGMLFYVFFEATLIPMYLIIGIWGGPNKIYAAFKFFLYTLLGSLLMLIALIYLYTQSGGSFDLATWHKLPLGATAQTYLFFAFFAAFAVKVPLFPLHTWLPDAHTQAPTGGSVILAGVLLKLGTYGLLRFGVYLFPEAALWSREIFLTLAVIGIIWGAIAATMQTDLKRLVAYSSVAHLGFIVLGTFAFSSQSVSGGVMQMVNHGVSTGALFLLVGMIYERRHTRQIAELKGLQKVAPIFAGVFMVVMLSSIGVPGLNGFVGEFLVLIGAFPTARWWTVIAATGVILAALYLLWAYQRVFHGEPDEQNSTFAELKLREGLVLAPFIAIIVFCGVYPKPMLDRIEPSVNALLDRVEVVTGYAAPEASHSEPANAEGEEE